MLKARRLIQLKKGRVESFQVEKAPQRRKKMEILADPLPGTDWLREQR